MACAVRKGGEGKAYVAGDQLRVDHARHLAMHVQAAAREVLKDAARVGEAADARAGGAVGIQHGAVEGDAGGAAAEH